MRRVLKVVVAGIGGLLGLAVVLVGVWILIIQFGGPRAEPLPTDPVTYLNELHADLAENAAPFYKLAEQTYVAPEDPDWLGLWFGPWNDPLADDVVAWLESNRECIEALDEVLSRPHCWFELASKDVQTITIVERRFPPLSGHRGLAKLLAVDARRATERRDWQTLARRVMTIDSMGRHYLTQPLVLDAWVGFSMCRVGVAVALAPVASGSLKAEQIPLIVPMLGPIFEPLPTMKACYEGEHIVSVSILDKLPAGRVRRGLASMFVPTGRLLGEFDVVFSRLVRWSELPVEQQLDPTNAIYQSVVQMGEREPSLWHPLRWLADMLGESLISVQRGWVLTVASQRGLHTTLMVHEYRAKSGRWPETLGEVAGALAVELPTDPFSGRAFGYRHTEDSFVLYSAGFDRDDDGGRHNRTWGEESPPGVPHDAWEPDGDYVFWPVQWD